MVFFPEFAKLAFNVYILSAKEQKIDNIIPNGYDIISFN